MRRGTGSVLGLGDGGWTFAGFGGGRRLVPLVRLGQAVGERGGRCPPELVTGPLVRNSARLEVAGTGRPELDDAGTDERAHRLRDLLDRHRHRALDVVRAVLGDGIE